MKSTRFHILAIAPYDALKVSLQEEAAQYPNLRLDAYTGDLAEGVEIALQKESLYYDAVISRGGTADLLRASSSLPVISVPITVYDVLRTIKMAENSSEKFAIVGFHSVTDTAHTLCDLLQYDIEIITIHDASDIPDALRHLQENGTRLVICDMIAHTKAKEMGFSALLITSGPESVRQALDQAVSLCRSFRSLRMENRFLHSFSKDADVRIVVLDPDGDLVYTTLSDPSEEVLSLLRKHLDDVPAHREHTFFSSRDSGLYEIHAERLYDADRVNVLFWFQTYKLPLHTRMPGIRIMHQSECRHNFLQTFCGVTGVTSGPASRVPPLAVSSAPVMILGEPGTCKQQIASALYLNSRHVRSFYLTIDCALVNEKGWNYLFDSESSPLMGDRGTVYFEHLENMPARRLTQFLSILRETNLAKRIRLIFSCDYTASQPLHPTAAAIRSQAPCLTLELAPLRERAAEIPRLAVLYLLSLNLEMNKQIIGLDAEASLLLQQYDWPGNDRQLQQILAQLASVTDTSYVRGSEVRDLLAAEEGLLGVSVPSVLQKAGEKPRTLDEITSDIIVRTVKNCGGNQSVAAKQLNISRSTLWRYLKKTQSEDSV